MPRLALVIRPPSLPSGRVPFRGNPFEASPLAGRLTETPGRIEFTVVTDETFTFSCSPPRLMATQLLSVTKGQTPFDRDLHPADSQPSQAHLPAASGAGNRATGNRLRKPSCRPPRILRPVPGTRSPGTGRRRPKLGQGDPPNAACV